MPHLLRLTQVEEVVSLNAVWAELTTASKSQQLLVLQRAFNKAAADLSLGLHAFTLGQHTAARQKLLKTRVDRHNLMAGGHAEPSLADAEELVAPDGVTILTSHRQSSAQHNRLRSLGHTLFGERHTPSKQLKTFGQEMGRRATSA